MLAESGDREPTAGEDGGREAVGVDLSGGKELVSLGVEGSQGYTGGPSAAGCSFSRERSIENSGAIKVRIDILTGEGDGKTC